MKRSGRVAGPTMAGKKMLLVLYKGQVNTKMKSFYGQNCVENRNECWR
ncbi:hypothetical protein B4168_4084 [Anoxybacillus flavithermus]|nr:hypothetical protein B4168_4084 [Anoxybacillus flavithermus]OAO84422.1 hypothetical protein GT23_3572 [Parageobacillus thermoglucosidasius]